MRIGLTYDLKPEHTPAHEPVDRYDELDVVETVDAIEEVLRARGHEVERLGGGPALFDALMRGAARRLDGVFNFSEGMGDRGREAQVPALLEMMGVPVTGSPPLVLAIALDKGLAKTFAAKHGLPTPPFSLAATDTPPDDTDLTYPLFAKPIAEGSSIGIRKHSVCRSPDALRALVEQLHRDYRQPVLVEEFLPGDEYTVGVVGNGKTAEVIGLMQVVPVEAAVNFVYSLEVKRDYLNRVRYLMTDDLLQRGRTVAELDAVRELALRVHRAFGCRDVSRVDIRCDRHGLPNFIEVNPLPGLNPVHSDLVIIARGHGWTYDDLIGRIFAAAATRWSTQRSPF
jgi:D-alanine-D-alanine ligase